MVKEVLYKCQEGSTRIGGQMNQQKQFWKKRKLYDHLYGPYKSYSEGTSLMVLYRHYTDRIKLYGPYKWPYDSQLCETSSR